jgi:hypothetical protein
MIRRVNLDWIFAIFAASQLLFSLTPIRKIRRHEALEDFSVIRRDDMENLMDYYKLSKLLWQFEQFTIQGRPS